MSVHVPYGGTGMGDPVKVPLQLNPFIRPGLGVGSVRCPLDWILGPDILSYLNG